MAFLVHCAAEQCKRTFDIAPTRRERLEGTLLRHRFCPPCFSNPDVSKRSSKPPHENLIRITNMVERVNKSMPTISPIAAQDLRPDLSLGHVRRPDENKRKFFANCENCAVQYKLPPNNKHWNKCNVRRCPLCRGNETTAPKIQSVEAPSAPPAPKRKAADTLDINQGEEVKVSVEWRKEEPEPSEPSLEATPINQDQPVEEKPGVYASALTSARSESEDLAAECEVITKRLILIRKRREILDEIVNSLSTLLKTTSDQANI